MKIEDEIISWLNQFSDHIIITDENAVVLHANRAVEAVTGFSHAEIIGKKAGDLWGGHMSREFYKDMWRTIKQDKKPFVGFVHNQQKDGKYYYAELRIYPVLDKQGNLLHFIAIEPDVTEQMTRQVMQENFVSLVKHELRNALGATKLMLGILAQEVLTKEQLELIQGIDEENDRITDTINTLSLLGKSKTAAENYESIQLDDIIDRSVLRLNEEKKVKILKSDASSPINFVSSRNIVEHVVENIISNAIKYSPEQGVVRITIDRTEKGICFSCKDAGIGIPHSEQVRLFDSFFRASNAKNEKGTGVGLFVTRELLERIGGSITVHSKLGKGTEVTVWFPTRI